MKIHVLSDLHTEFRGFTAPDTAADVVVLAGDIGTGIRGLAWAAGQDAFQGKQIVYVAGNHEFYGARLERIAVELRRVAKELGILYLDNDSALINNQVRIIGATLWTDFELFGSDMRSISDALHAAKASLSDFSAIIYGTTGFLRPERTVELHRVTRRFIEHELDAADAEGLPTVVVTHHAPSWASIHPRWQRDIVSACFASRLDDLACRPHLWIHGHTHSSFDYRLGDDPRRGRVVANPRGYPRMDGQENPDFDPAFVVEVGA